MAEPAADWRAVLAALIPRPLAFQAAERARGRLIYPSEADLFRALDLTPPGAVRVVILGQDPYHGPGQAHGLSFSVPQGARIPPSLRNIFRELHTDLGIPPAPHGCLEPWARQGVLLLNTLLSVEAGRAGSHRGKGWEAVTEAVIGAVNQGPAPTAFLLWGAQARAKAAAIDAARHLVLQAPHPSPLSARTGFLGSRPFSQTNAFLRTTGRGEIDWRLPD